MTNFEWLMTLSEEEFTNWVYDQWLHHLQYKWSSSRGGLMIWLKEERAEQTENSSEKPNNCECEPRKEQNFCGKCRYLYRDFKYGLSCYRLMDNEPCKYEERKDEPTISKMEQVEDEPQTHDICTNTHECVKDTHDKDEPQTCEECEHWNDTEDGCADRHGCKTEPQTDYGDFADRLAYERGVKHAWEVAQKVFDSTVTFYEAEDVAKQIDKDINVRSKERSE